MPNFRSYFRKNNTIIKDNKLNFSQNPVHEISYGSSIKTPSRYIFEINLDNLISKLQNGDINENTIQSHILHLTNTIRYNESYLGTNLIYDDVKRASSFKLELFNITEDWDEGSGYDFVYDDSLFPALFSGASNWNQAKTTTPWISSGIYTSTGSTILGEQYFNKGSENISIDITNFINDILFSGNTSGSYGIGIKFADEFETGNTFYRHAVAFYGKHTNTFFEPYLETIYNNQIKDDRNYFYLDTDNKLFLSSIINGVTQNISVNSVDIYDYKNQLIDTITGSNLYNSSKGFYYIDYNVSSSGYPDQVLFKDVWNITINGVDKSYTQKFLLIDNNNFDLGFKNQSYLDNYQLQLSGIKYNQNIVAGDIKRVYVKTKRFYNTQDENIPLNINYRLYIKQTGSIQIDVIPLSKINRINDTLFFDIDTSWLIPQDYILEVSMNYGDFNDVKETVKFTIITK